MNVDATNKTPLTPICNKVFQLITSLFHNSEIYNPTFSLTNSESKEDGAAALINLMI